ncbi:MAG: GNAT family N-acetyltransferase [Candidatus Heimdallarchaeota archaeon]
MIRKATKNDIPSLISLWEETDLRMKSNGRDKPENLEKQMQQPYMWILVAEDNSGEIVGAVIVTNDSRKGWINRLAVNPQQRRKGIAKKLLIASEKSLIEIGITVFSALIESNNITSAKLFDSTGYNHIEGVTYYAKKIHPYD